MPIHEVLTPALVELRRSKAPMTKDSNRRRQQSRREKLRTEGLVMREIWIRPEHGPLLLKVEKLLRKQNAHPLIHALQGVSTAMSNGQVTAPSLFSQLQAGASAAANKFSYRLLEGVDPVIL